MAKGSLPAPLGAPLAYLPVGLSEAAHLLEALAEILEDQPAFEPGALPLRDTELWVIGAEVASVSVAEGKVVVELVPGPAYHFVALPTASFYPYPIWDDGAKIVTMQLTTGEPYEQVVPATYGAEFPSLATTFEARAGVVPAALASALAFGLAHLSREEPADSLIPVVVAVCLGLGLALLYERRGNLLAPLAGHAAFNAVGVPALLTRT